jgi:hypothetical protein
MVAAGRKNAIDAPSVRELNRGLREKGCLELRQLKTDYIPELSEVRMVRRAPERPFLLSAEDARYIEACLRDIERAFGFEAFPGKPVSDIPGRILIGRFIYWWRAFEPEDTPQREAHARLPGAIRLLDTVSSFMEEMAQRKQPRHT